MCERKVALFPHVRHTHTQFCVKTTILELNKSFSCEKVTWMFNEREQYRVLWKYIKYTYTSSIINSWGGTLTLVLCWQLLDIVATIFWNPKEENDAWMLYNVSTTETPLWSILMFYSLVLMLRDISYSVWIDSYRQINYYCFIYLSFI